MAIRHLPAHNAATRVFRQLGDTRLISSLEAGRFHQGFAARIQTETVLTLIGREWCRSLADSGLIRGAEKPDTWTLPRQQ